MWLSRVVIFALMFYAGSGLVTAGGFSGAARFDTDLLKRVYTVIRSDCTSARIGWEAAVDGDGFVLTKTRPDERQVLRCRSNLDFISLAWFKGGELYMSINRSGDELIMSCKAGRGIREQRCRLARDQVVYSSSILGFLFTAYPFERRDALDFQMVSESSDHFGVMRMQVRNEGIDRLEIQGRTISAYRLRFSPAGIGGRFYYAFFWHMVSAPHIMVKQDMRRGEVLLLNE